MPTHTRDIHGHKVTGEDDVVKGLDHLDYHLSYEEAEVFFREARNRGKVLLEDNERRNYTLIYPRTGPALAGRCGVSRSESPKGLIPRASARGALYNHDGTYALKRRKSGGFFSGWF